VFTFGTRSEVCAACAEEKEKDWKCSSWVVTALPEASTFLAISVIIDVLAFKKDLNKIIHGR